MNYAIGYQQAKTLMKENGWTLIINYGVGSPMMYVRDPNSAMSSYTVRWDSGSKLKKECRLIESESSASRKVYRYNDESVENGGTHEQGQT